MCSRKYFSAIGCVWECYEGAILAEKGVIQDFSGYRFFRIMQINREEPRNFFCPYVLVSFNRELREWGRYSIIRDYNRNNREETRSRGDSWPRSNAKFFLNRE